mmetsp:Transcript_20970/g.49813  ORF Transcript_20970/g.49813 Transcript_20970/m.49813 type:complete len:296 (+) Transcript_20970:156-1043(+)
MMSTGISSSSSSGSGSSSSNMMTMMTTTKFVRSLLLLLLLLLLTLVTIRSASASTTASTTAAATSSSASTSSFKVVVDPNNNNVVGKVVVSPPTFHIDGLLSGTGLISRSNPVAHVVDHDGLQDDDDDDGRRTTRVDEHLRHVLSTTGLFAVRLSSPSSAVVGNKDDDEDTDDHYQHARTTALQGLCRCYNHPQFHDIGSSTTEGSNDNNKNNNNNKKKKKKKQVRVSKLQCRWWSDRKGELAWKWKEACICRIFVLHARRDATRRDANGGSSMDAAKTGPQSGLPRRPKAEGMS